MINDKALLMIIYKFSAKALSRVYVNLCVFPLRKIMFDVSGKVGL